MKQRKRQSALLLLGASVLLLTLLFPPFYCFFFAPIALVPLCVCILRRPLTKWYLLAYYLTGAAFFTPNLFWLGPVTIGGFIGLALFLALYFVLFAFGVHRLVVQMRLPATLAVPLVWTAVEYFRATYVLGGFPWFLLGNCLTPLPVLIQAADLLGVWGLSFLIAMLNGFVVDILRLPLRQVVKGQSRFSPTIARLTAITTLLLASYLAYGIYRLNQQTTHPGPRITVLQENIPQSIKDSAGDITFLKHLRLSETAASMAPKPDLVVWPETMVTVPINDEWLGLMPDPFEGVEGLYKVLDAIVAREKQEIAAAQKIADREERAGAESYAHFTAMRLRILNYFKALKDQSERYQVPLLLGYGADIPVEDSRHPNLQNRTLLLGTPGRPAEYSKRHLVPFGEFIPFREIPLLGRMMMVFSPVDYDYSLTPGTAWTRFSLPVRTTDASATQVISSTHIYKFGTPICFEDTMPEPSRQMSAPQYDGGKKADFLLNVSNDGWFHWVELEQHLQATQLRAVENRVPIARSVNTGNSGFIDSNGRIVKLVRDAQGNSLGAVGTESWVLQIDARVTLFSSIGDIFPIICGIASTLLVGWTLVRPRHAGAAPPASAAA